MAPRWQVYRCCRHIPNTGKNRAGRNSELFFSSYLALEGGLRVKRKDGYALTEQGNSMVILGTSSQMNYQLITLGSFLTKQRGETLHIRYIVEVPRSLPLMAVLAREMEQADALLNTAREVA